MKYVPTFEQFVNEASKYYYDVHIAELVQPNVKKDMTEKELIALIADALRQDGKSKIAVSNYMNDEDFIPDVLANLKESLILESLNDVEGNDVNESMYDNYVEYAPGVIGYDKQKTYGSGPKSPLVRVIYYWDTGKPRYSRPIAEVLQVLREMGIKEIPKKTKVGDDIELSDGTRLAWYKSSPPAKNLYVEVDPKNEKKYADMMIAATELKVTGISDSQQQLWDSIHPNITQYFTECWDRPLTAADLASGGKDNFIINWNNSRYIKANLPAGFKVIPDPKTTAWTVRAPKCTFHVAPHTFNSTLKVERL